MAYPTAVVFENLCIGLNPVVLCVFHTLAGGTADEQLLERTLFLFLLFGIREN